MGSRRREAPAFLRALIGLILGGVLAGLAAAAVSPVTITLWHAYEGAEREALEQVLAGIDQRLTQVEIQARYIPFLALADRVPAADRRGKGPDLFIYAHDRIGGWVREGVLRPLDDRVRPAVRERFFASAIDAATYRERLYGLPLALKMVALYYNKRLVPEPPDTLEELIATARRLTRPAEERYGLAYEYNNYYYQAMWVQGFGGRIFDDSFAPVLRSDAHVRALELVHRLKDKEHILPPEISKAYVLRLFNEGKAAMVIDGPWLKGELNESLDYGISLLPNLAASGELAFQRALPFLTSECVLLLASSPHPDAAFAVMEELTAASSQVILARRGGQVPANMGAYRDIDVYHNPDLISFRQQALFSYPMPNHERMTAVWTPATMALGRVLVGSHAPAEALGEAEKAVLASIEEDGL